ncbi:hypothetical protein IMG5_015620 [Ichthyophthirius multifiliis]|uniref:Transmembrane protein n=1 Tax=Ichthyophthirius multifiliis TaxID=5932 RepID=G0QKB6_ICHMU|nr:hypothetical protein IMG5_015620 [Ichthyophthirius multifiliis]EGR34338.1 hypothetical protein IMG5_015620 [Ichthyophthirius multifiliis]|eukprot:XP_004039642.1 hypothetical protein IMG5_015620 [Ichthyophthirius multifiliis]
MLQIKIFYSNLITINFIIKTTMQTINNNNYNNLKIQCIKIGKYNFILQINIQTIIFYFFSIPLSIQNTMVQQCEPYDQQKYYYYQNKQENLYNNPQIYQKLQNQRNQQNNHVSNEQFFIQRNQGNDLTKSKSENQQIYQNYQLNQNENEYQIQSNLEIQYNLKKTNSQDITQITQLQNSQDQYLQNQNQLKNSQINNNNYDNNISFQNNKTNKNQDLVEKWQPENLLSQDSDLNLITQVLKNNKFDQEVLNQVLNDIKQYKLSKQLLITAIKLQKENTIKIKIQNLKYNNFKELQLKIINNKYSPYKLINFNRRNKQIQEQSQTFSQILIIFDLYILFISYFQISYFILYLFKVLFIKFNRLSLCNLFNFRTFSKILIIFEMFQHQISKLEICNQIIIQHQTLLILIRNTQILINSNQIFYFKIYLSNTISQKTNQNNIKSLEFNKIFIENDIEFLIFIQVIFIQFFPYYIETIRIFFIILLNYYLQYLIVLTFTIQRPIIQFISVHISQYHNIQFLNMNHQVF